MPNQVNAVIESEGLMLLLESLPSGTDLSLGDSCKFTAHPCGPLLGLGIASGANVVGKS